MFILRHFKTISHLSSRANLVRCKPEYWTTRKRGKDVTRANLEHKMSHGLQLNDYQNVHRETENFFITELFRAKGTHFLFLYSKPLKTPGTCFISKFIPISDHLKWSKWVLNIKVNKFRSESFF